jgi:hypothetical protein
MISDAINLDMKLKIWLPYFSSYIKKRNLKNSELYVNNDNKILILPKSKEFPLKSNIFFLKDNIAYQYYCINNNLVSIKNILLSIEYSENSIIFNDNIYDKQDLNINIDNIIFLPFQHTIDFTYKSLQNKYEIQFISNIFTEYIKFIPPIYIYNDLLSIKYSTFLSIQKYLSDNNYIGNIYK